MGPRCTRQLLSAVPVPIVQTLVSVQMGVHRMTTFADMLAMHANKQRDIHDVASAFITAAYDRERYLYQRHLHFLYDEMWRKEWAARRVAQMDRATVS